MNKQINKFYLEYKELENIALHRKEARRVQHVQQVDKWKLRQQRVLEWKWSRHEDEEYARSEKGESDIQFGNGGDPIRHLAPWPPLWEVAEESEARAISGPP